MLKEFKAFAMKGNMLDMAIGIIIGAAFGTVVKSLVDDIIMPVVAWIFGSPDFSNLFIVLKNPTGDVFTSIEAAREAGAAVLGYGLFLNAVVALLIVAFALFMVVKGVNRMQEMAKKKEEEEAAPAGPTEIELLTEIRDSLKK